jgi:hypothetical protein
MPELPERLGVPIEALLRRVTGSLIVIIRGRPEMCSKREISAGAFALSG